VCIPVLGEVRHLILHFVIVFRSSVRLIEIRCDKATLTDIVVQRDMETSS
jgi:hypothetical protein